MGQPLEVQILSSAAKQAREFKQPEAKMDWARGGCEGAKSSRATTAASDPSGTGGLIEGGNRGEEALGIGVGRIGGDLFRWALLNKFAML